MVCTAKTIADCQKLFFSLLLSILHWLVIGQTKASDWLSGPASALLERALGPVLAREEAKSIVRKRGSQPAFPTTVAIILADTWAGEQGLDLLIALSHWLAAAGVKYLQFYEASGKLKACAAEITRRLNFQNQRYTVTEWAGATHRDTGRTQLPDSEGEGGASEGEGAFHASITILSQDDGRKTLLDTINSKKKDAKGIGDMDKGSFIERISRAVGPHAVKQPDLVWSEIHGMGQLADLSMQDVDEALQRYCQTSQRFGR